MEVVQAYRAWDPSDGSTVEDLAKALGIARQTIYAVLQRHNVPLKGMEPSAWWQRPDIVSQVGVVLQYHERCGVQCDCGRRVGEILLEAKR